MNDFHPDRPKGLPLRNKSDFINRVKRQTSSKDIKFEQFRNYSKVDCENKDNIIKINSPISNKDIVPFQNNYVDDTSKPKQRQRFSILGSNNSSIDDKPRLQTTHPSKRLLMRFPCSIEKVPLDTLKRLFRAKCDDLKLVYVEKQQNRFLEFCSKSIKLTKLSINECGLGVRASEIIAEIIKMNTDFRHLELVNNNISDDGLKIITDALMCNHTIISVDFSLCSISCEGSDYFFDKLAKHPTIIDVNISNNEGLHKNKISSKGCARLKELLIKNPVLSYLNVADNSLGVEGLKLLAQGLEKSHSLVSLNVSNNNLPNNAITYLTEGIMSSSLRELVIRKNELGDKCVLDILDIVHKKTFPLEVLDLSFNQISSNAANMLLQALKSNKCITKLSLSQNPFHQPLVQLGMCLRMNKKLRYLHLSDCELSEDNGEYIAEGLKDNKGLICLVLDGNKLSDKGVNPIGISLKHNTTLKQIDLSSNNIADDGCMGIVEGLKENNTIESISLRNNKIGNQSACYLMHIVALNNSLIFMNLQLNLFHYKYTEGIEEKIKKNYEVKKKEKAPQARKEYSTLRKYVVESSTHPLTKQQLKEEKQKEKKMLAYNQNVYDNIVNQENQNLQDLIDEQEQIAKRSVQIKHTMKELDYEMDDLDAKMARNYEAKLNDISKLKGENALLERRVEQQQAIVHSCDIRNRFSLSEVEDTLKRLHGKLECTEMIINEKQKMIDELNSEIEPPKIEPIPQTEEVEPEKKKKKKKKKLRKHKVKKCCADHSCR